MIQFRRRRSIRFDRGHALIVTAYQPRDFTQLRDAISDNGRDLAALLTDSRRCGYPSHQVTVLQQPTDGDVLNHLKRLANDAEPRDTVILFFSCHAGLVSSTLRLFLHQGTSLDSSCFSKELVYFRAERLLILLDCCHAEGLAHPGELGGDLVAAGNGRDQTKSPIEEFYSRLAMGRGRVVLGASRFDQKAFYLAGMRNSLLTHHVLEALRGRAGGRWRSIVGASLFAIPAAFRQALERSRFPFGWAVGPLRRIESVLGDWGWGTIRLYDLHRYVSKKVLEESKGSHSTVLKAAIAIEFAIALRIASPHSFLFALLVLAAVFLSTARPCFNCCEARLSLSIPPIVHPSFTARTSIRRLCHDFLRLHVLIAPDRPDPRSWLLAGSRTVQGTGTEELELMVPPELQDSSDRFVVKAILTSTLLDFVDPIDETYIRNILRPEAVSELVRIAIGEVDIQSINNLPRDRLIQSPNVPVTISLTGMARNLDGSAIEVLTGPLQDMGVPWVVRERVPVVAGRWEAHGVPVRGKYQDRYTHYAVWARTKGEPVFRSTKWKVVIRLPAIRITAINSQDTAGCTVERRDLVQVHGQASDVLPDERVWVAVRGKRYGTSTGLWKRSGIVSGSSWDIFVDVRDGDEFEIWAATRSSVSDESVLNDMGSPVRCEAE